MVAGRSPYRATLSQGPRASSCGAILDAPDNTIGGATICAGACAGAVAGGAGDALSDYSDYLGAQALMEANRSGEVFPLLDHFAERHPESIFDASAPLLLANAFIQQKNGPAAVKVLESMLGTPEADHPEFKFALGRAYPVPFHLSEPAARVRSFTGSHAAQRHGHDALGRRA